jgi:hypothetical protein
MRDSSYPRENAISGGAFNRAQMPSRLTNPARDAQKKLKEAPEVSII